MESKIEQLLEQLITAVNDESTLDREKLLAIIEEVRAETAEHKASEKIAAAEERSAELRRITARYVDDALSCVEEVIGSAKAMLNEAFNQMIKEISASKRSFNQTVKIS